MVRRTLIGLVSLICIPNAVQAQPLDVGTMYVLEPPLDDEGNVVPTTAWSINNHGTVVGTAGNLPVRWGVDRELEVLDGDVVTYHDDGSATRGPLLWASLRTINESGSIAGTVSSNFLEFPSAIWDDAAGVWITLPMPEGAWYASVLAMNDRGELVGSSSQGPFLWTGSESLLLPTLGPVGEGSCTAWGLNNAGVITGWCLDGDGVRRGVVWRNGKLEVLADLGGSYTYGRAANSGGWIAGFSGDDFGNRLPGSVMLWDSREPAQVEVLAEYGSGNAINGRGDVAGFLGINSADPSDPTPTAVIFPHGGPNYVELGTLGGGFGFPRDINDRRQVVGVSDTAEGDSLPFLWVP